MFTITKLQIDDLIQGLLLAKYHVDQLMDKTEYETHYATLFNAYRVIADLLVGQNDNL